MNGKHIVIIGGMGPQASLLLHRRIIDFAVKKGAKLNSDYPKITHISIPVPDFISDMKQKPKAVALIKKSLRCLWR